MTRLKKIGVALVLVVAVLVLGIVAALGADDIFTGSMYRLSIYVKDSCHSMSQTSTSRGYPFSSYSLTRLR